MIFFNTKTQLTICRNRSVMDRCCPSGAVAFPGPEFSTFQYFSAQLNHLQQMMLRSAASRELQPNAADLTTVGSFIELRSDDPSTKPWMAKILATRQVREDSSEPVEEVECEWLWHPTEAVKDFELDNQFDPSFYGSREVFLGGGLGESGRDWNPVDSVKYRVYVIPLELYKQVAASGFQMQLSPEDPLTLSILDPSRCWYYRQILRTDENNLKTLHPPSLPLVIHRPNPEFHRWCHQNGKSVKSLHPTDDPSIPPRTILVPENPERLYFYCVDCHRQFETRQGDCIGRFGSRCSTVGRQSGSFASLTGKA